MDYIDEAELHTDDDIFFENDKEEKFKLSIEQTKEKTKDTSVSLDDFRDSWIEIVDFREDQKTMHIKAREHIDKIAKERWFTDSIDFWTHHATKWRDKLFIKEERTKWEHDANDKYLRQFANVLWINDNGEKIKVITDIRKSWNDLFSR